MVAILLITLSAFLIAVAFMAVGVIFSGRCLRGSCGGNPVLGPDGEPLLCATCPNRDKLKQDSCEPDGVGACPRESAPTH
ncbi:MAG: hypothetical protein SGI88_06730 [Candidatus Hydrogenedentes bacterium]|nr:hypothetical protein [Candidatus Hydrogenedentota bacterium]